VKGLELSMKRSADGAIHFICFDWRHLGEILKVGEELYTELKNLCVWNKTNGGMVRSTVQSTSWSLSIRSARHLTSTILSSVRTVAIAITFGIMRVRTHLVRAANANWLCIRRSSPWVLWPMRFVTVPISAGSFLIRLAEREPRSWSSDRPGQMLFAETPQKPVHYSRS
jgi:hypothetical protein